MLPAYVFSLVLGGGFLLISVLGDLLGGGDAALDIDVDVDVDVDLGGDSGAGALKIFSFRTVTYALFGFGAVGTMLNWLELGTPTSNLVFALVGGAASGAIVTTAFSYLRATDSGAHPGDRTLVGLAGHVSLPLSWDVPGTVVVERGNRRLSLRALPHESSSGTDASEWTNVVVVEMDDGIARVAPVSQDLLIEGS